MQELERALLGLVYESLLPRPDADFTDKLSKLVFMTPNHPALDIPTAFQEGAPWPNVQQDLRATDAYISPADKLGCVVAVSFERLNAKRIGTHIIHFLRSITRPASAFSSICKSLVVRRVPTMSFQSWCFASSRRNWCWLRPT